MVQHLSSTALLVHEANEALRKSLSLEPRRTALSALELLIRDVEEVAGHDIRLLLNSDAPETVMDTAALCYLAYEAKGGEHNFLEAERRFRLSIIKSPRKAEPYLGLGLLLYARGEPDSTKMALVQFRKAESLGSDNAKALVATLSSSTIQPPSKVITQIRNENVTQLGYSDDLASDKTVYTQKFSEFIRSLNEADQLGLSTDDVREQAERAAQALVARTPEQARPDAPGPMPTTDELEAKGKLYSQARLANPSTNIVEHLKDVWMPFIERGTLTRPELRSRDMSSYKALSQWLYRGGDLEKALGHGIPGKSEVINSYIAAVASLPPKERPIGVKWVLDKRGKAAR